MNRRRALLVAGGVAAVALGVVLGRDDQLFWAWSGGVTLGVIVLTLAAIGIAYRKIRGSLDTNGDEPPVSWAPGEPFADPAPERSDRSPSLSSDELAGVIERGGIRARESGTVDDGLAVVRPPLRTALLEALEAGGRSRSDAEAALETGAWTDDRLAASVLDEAVEPPDRPFRERVRAWLFPERVVRERSRRAMAAVADAADEALPTVPGQTAPRTKPVMQPRLEELERGADGNLQRAVDPMATVRGPRPPRPRLGADADGADAGADADDAIDGGDDPAAPEVTDR